MKSTIFTKFTWLLALCAVVFTSLFYVACTKDVMSAKEDDTVKPRQETVAMLTTSKAPNPFSVTNIQQALSDLGRTDPLDNDRIYYYYSFDPSNVTGDMLSIVEADQNHHILDYPFANGDAFKDNFTSNYAASSAAARDGKLYIVFKKGGSLDNLFENNGQLSATKLDELYLPQQNDKDLQLKAMANAQGVTVEAFKISWPCLFKQPHGRVTYLDTETNQTRGVPAIQVWAIAFGIPIPTWTNDNGYYAVPWLFSIGTVIGTHAKSPYVNVKPFDVTGSVVNAIAQVVANFIIGSVHIENAFSSCDMKNNININFNQNNQKRYWAQILDAVRLHHTFAAQDGINAAPWGLTWYAAWDNQQGDAYSAPMLSHLSGSLLPTPTNIANIFSLYFDTNLLINAPNLFNLLNGLLPSITTDESPSSMTDVHYSERLMQGALHELAHASLFTKVGQIYWAEVISNIVTVRVGSSCPGYGCGNEIFAGNTQVNEAWAEYLGKDYHRRIHPNGERETAFNTWQGYPLALENHKAFINDWIPTGVFFDLTDPFNQNELNDNIQGFTNAQMFNIFSPNIHNFCDFQNRLIQLNPNVTAAQFSGVLTQNGRSNCGL
jgi:hypothetical protein